MKKVIGLAGAESSFLHRLKDYINLQGETEVFLCTKEESFIEEVKNREPVVVFCMEDFAKDADLNVERIDFIKERDSERGIFLYQTAAGIYKELRNYIGKDIARAGTVDGAKEICAVYSPIGRSGKTSFACAYAREHSFFYISMEEYGIATNDFCNSGDLLYSIKNRKTEITQQIRDQAEQIDGVFVIGAPIMFADIRLLDVSDYEWFLNQIREDEGMPSVIVDFGSGCLSTPEVLDLFDRIFLPILPGRMEEEKLHKFKNYLYEVNGRMEEKLHEIIVPAVSWKNPDFLEKVRYMDGLIYE